jgi:hypothetical protein
MAIETCTCWKVDGCLYEDHLLAVKAEYIKEIQNLFNTFVVLEGITTDMFTMNDICEFVSKKKEELNALLTDYIAKYTAAG